MQNPTNVAGPSNGLSSTQMPSKGQSQVIRKRPTGIKGPFELCQYYNSGLSCRKTCTFAHGEAERNAWTKEILKGLFLIFLFWALLLLLLLVLLLLLLLLLLILLFSLSFFFVLSSSSSFLLIFFKIIIT